MTEPTETRTAKGKQAATRTGPARGRCRSFATAELAEGEVRAIASSRMSRTHDHLDVLLHEPKPDAGARE